MNDFEYYEQVREKIFDGKNIMPLEQIYYKMAKL